MSLRQILALLGINDVELVAALQKAAEVAPDLHDFVKMTIAKIDAGVSPSNFAALVAASPKEFKDILAGQLKPTDDPSNAI